MNFRNIFTPIILFVMVLSLASCHKDPDDVAKPNNPNENEMITSMKVVLENTATNDITEFLYQDVDGDGKPSVFDTIRLLNNAEYAVNIILLDESKIPVDTISNHVVEEAVEHQLFYTVSNAAVTISYEDLDENNVPLGLETTWQTGNVTTSKDGKIRVTLKHQGEDKPTSGNGDITIGSTDVEIDFPVIIYPSI